MTYQHTTYHPIRRGSLPLWLCLVLLGIASVAGSFSQAQESSSVSIKAKAIVIEYAEIELITIKDLVIDYSDIIDGKVDIPPRTHPQAGMMMVKGRPNTQIRVSYIPEIRLRNSQGPGTLVMNYELFGSSENNQNASERIDNAERPIYFNDQGIYYIWLGGRVNVTKSGRGKYFGEFTIEFEYI